jgi:hypothetical protein
MKPLSQQGEKSGSELHFTSVVPAKLLDRISGTGCNTAR